MNSRYPTVILHDETMREGMQIESATIGTADKIRLLDAISGTGLKVISVGSFVSPTYTPQMAHIDEIVSGFTPRAGVTYISFTANQKGIDRSNHYSPPLKFKGPNNARLNCTLSDTFIRRNYNSTQQAQIDKWPAIVERAVSEGVTSAEIGIGAAFGSNFEGRFDRHDRFSKLEAQYALWEAAGIPVTAVSLADPMSWCMPDVVEDTITEIRDKWPSIDRFLMHLHDARGMAMPSTYAAIRALGPQHTVRFDCTLGGIGGCPYCGNGQATGMAPMEDVVAMLEALGIPTGVDLEALIRAVWLLEEILGRPTMGHVSKAGPMPEGDALYDPNIPFIETFEHAKHFLNGPSAWEGAISPWKEPIPAPERRS